MGKSSGNTDTAPFDNSRSHKHKPRITSPPGMTTETQMVLWAALDALWAAGPAEHDADAPTLIETEKKPPAPAFKKHSGDPETTKVTSASKKHANGVNDEKKTPAPEKPTTGAEAERNPPPSSKLTAAATQKKKTSASTKPTRKTTKTTASSKPAPKKPAVKIPAAKQLSNNTDATKETRRTARLPPKRMDVLLPGPHEEVSSDSSDTDTPNPALVTGADPPVVDASQDPRAQTSTTGSAAPANPAITPPSKRSPSPNPSLRVDYEESEPAMDREAGEVEGPWSSPPLADEQQVLHPGCPMSPKTMAAIARARALEEALSRRDDPPPATLASQVITNAGVDEGVPSELLQPENRQHLSDRSRQTALQPIGTKRERETPGPRTREKLLALRYWTREEYRASSPESDAWSGRAAVRQLPGRAPVGQQFHPSTERDGVRGVVAPLGLSRARGFELSVSDWLTGPASSRFRMAKMIFDETWTDRFLEWHTPMPGGILEGVL
ncbi:unnamed protein product [Phytophthora fragariaefolia]|uniref:Unnamed protein product n=1 Tax=Phytophthora fragariaefolia TaxID=1490495 RepID=A0A9W6TV19_9STRA|nr:unnamed protein product [Phytophthora fragariaefolia]